jgi:hypothetical protein
VLAERRRYVGDVLEDLNAERPLEAGVWDRERGRVRFMERDVVVSFGTLCGHGEHVLADVQADDRALGPDGLKQLDVVETRAAAHVKDSVTGSCAERSSYQFATAQHVARPIEPLQPLGEAPIKLQLTHSATSPSRSRPCHPCFRTSLAPCHALRQLAWIQGRCRTPEDGVETSVD